MIETLGEEGVNTITRLANLMCDSGNIPEEHIKSIFTALPKKSNVSECYLHRMIILISHTLKIIIKVILEGIKGKIASIDLNTQCDCMPRELEIP